jgi:hypothetical protein
MIGTLDCAAYRRNCKICGLPVEEGEEFIHALLHNTLQGQIKAANVPERVGDKSFARSLPPVVGRKFR